MMQVEILVNDGQEVCGNYIDNTGTMDMKIAPLLVLWGYLKRALTHLYVEKPLHLFSFYSLVLIRIVCIRSSTVHETEGISLTDGNPSYFKAGKTCFIPSLVDIPSFSIAVA